MTEEEIEKLIASYINEHNNKVMADFEGYSPGEMHKIIYHAFSDNSPVQLKELTDTEYRKVPLLNQIKYLMNVIAEKGELKLTNKGFLPTKVVADIYAQGFIKDFDIEKGISKLYKEADVMSINHTRILLEISGLIKKRNGKLSLTKEGGKIAGNNHLLLKRIITIFGYKFNWAYYDGYGENQIGRLGFAFSLILLHKYGHKKRDSAFYAEKYFKAFPHLYEDNNSSTRFFTSNASERCYSLRTFQRFLDYFGVVSDEFENPWDFVRYITKTNLFDRLFYIAPPGKK